MYPVVLNKPTESREHGLVLESNNSIGGFTVRDIQSGSPTAACGEIQKYDVIRTVNGDNVCGCTLPGVLIKLEKLEKRIILGIIRSSCRIVRRNMEFYLKKKQQDKGFDFGFICGDAWPRYEGDKCCYIHNIGPGGPADQVGLKVGDTLLRVNGKPLEGLPFGTVERILLPELKNPDGAVLTVLRTEWD